MIFSSFIKVTYQNPFFVITEVVYLLIWHLLEILQLDVDAQTIRRNIKKFSERFCFKLTNEESEIFLVEICDQKTHHIETCDGKYKNPRVFTEQGVAMLATIY